MLCYPDLNGPFDAWPSATEELSDLRPSHTLLVHPEHVFVEAIASFELAH